MSQPLSRSPGQAPNNLAIFDCDGTLVDSEAAIVAAIGESFAGHGLAIPSDRQARRVVGLSLDQAMASLVPGDCPVAPAAIAQTYRLAFARRRAAERVAEPLYPGIAALLDALAADGWLLAVATGKSDRGLRHCLEANGLAGRFISLQTADRHPSKPDPAMALAAIAEAGATPETSFVVGDTIFDIGMARLAGTRAIGAGWGYHDAPELLAAGAHAVVDQPAAILGYARGWAERLPGGR